MAFSNITVTGSISNVTVSEDLTNVSVSSTLSNIVVGQTSTVSNSVIRSAISNTLPITYNSSSGVIGLDPVTTMSDIVLPKLSDNTVSTKILTSNDIRSTSGNISADSLTANVTNEAFTGNVNASFLNVTVVDRTATVGSEDIPFGNANVKRISHADLNTKYFANVLFDQGGTPANIYQTQFKLKDNQDFLIDNASSVNNAYYRGKRHSSAIVSIGDHLPMNLESPDQGYFLVRTGDGTGKKDTKAELEERKKLFAELLGGDKARGEDISNMLMSFAGKALKPEATVKSSFGEFFEEESKRPSSKSKIDQSAAALAINDYIAGKRSKEQTEALLARLELSSGSLTAKYNDALKAGASKEKAIATAIYDKFSVIPKKVTSIPETLEEVNELGLSNGDIILAPNEVNGNKVTSVLKIVIDSTGNISTSRVFPDL